MNFELSAGCVNKNNSEKDAQATITKTTTRQQTARADWAPHN